MWFMDKAPTAKVPHKRGTLSCCTPYIPGPTASADSTDRRRKRHPVARGSLPSSSCSPPQPNQRPGVAAATHESRPQEAAAASGPSGTRASSAFPSGRSSLRLRPSLCPLETEFESSGSGFDEEEWELCWKKARAAAAAAARPWQPLRRRQARAGRRTGLVVEIASSREGWQDPSRRPSPAR